MMEPTRCPEITVFVVPIVDMVEKLSLYSDIPAEFHSGDTGTA